MSRYDVCLMASMLFAMATLTYLPVLLFQGGNIAIDNNTPPPPSSFPPSTLLLLHDMHAIPVSKDNMHMVVSHYNTESLDWMTEERRQLWNRSDIYMILYSKQLHGKLPSHLTHSEHFRDIVIGPSDAAGRECTGYISYIIDYYEKLPKTVLFVHGHGPTSNYHERFYTNQVALPRNGYEPNRERVYTFRCSLRDTDIRLHHRNLQRFFHAMGKYGNYPMVSSLWANETWAFAYDKAMCFGNYCCAEFIISRERILAQPKVFWEKILLILIDELNKQPDQPGGMRGVSRESCYAMESIWHVIFYDPSLSIWDLNGHTLHTPHTLHIESPANIEFT